MPLITRKTEIAPNFFSFNFLRVPRQEKVRQRLMGEFPPKDLPRVLVMASQSGRPQQGPGPAMGSMKDCLRHLPDRLGLLNFPVGH